MAQADPGPALAPELHRFVREVQEKDPAWLEFLDPEPEGVIPVIQVFQTVRAEDEIEGRVGERIQRVGILMWLISNRDRARERPFGRTDVDASSITELQSARRDVGARVSPIETLGIEFPSISVERAARRFDPPHEETIETPPDITDDLRRIPHRPPQLAGQH